MTFYLQTYPYRRMARRWAENREQSLRVNVREEDEAYVLSALVPGIHSDDLNIQVLEDVVRIEGEYKRSGPVDSADETNYLVREFPNGSFSRTLRRCSIAIRDGSTACWPVMPSVTSKTSASGRANASARVQPVSLSGAMAT